MEKLIKYEQALLAYETDEAQQFGLVNVGSEGNLSSVVERPHGKNKGLVNTGAYVLSQKYFNTKMVKISDKEYGLPQTLVAMHPMTKTKVVKTKKWQSIGVPKDLKMAQKKIKEFI